MAWQQLSKSSESGGSGSPTLEFQDFPTAHKNSRRLWTSLAQLSASISSSAVRLPESSFMTTRARFEACCAKFPSAISKIIG
jgi:hypothetical protein